MLVAAGMGVAMRPMLEAEHTNSVRLEAMVPKNFGNWHEIPNPTIPVDVALTTTGAQSNEQPYDDQLMRSYRNDQGEVMMVALAYGRNQRQEIKVHRPEVCYSANGGRVTGLTPVTFPITSLSGVQIVGNRLRADSDVRQPEAVSYWVRVGHIYSQSGFRQRWHILQEGLAGRRADGILVRVSQGISPGKSLIELYQSQERFAAELVKASSPEAQLLMIR
jgi:EpsI family protein